MAIDWQNTPTLSQVVVNGTNYYLKDAEARAMIETLSGNGLVTTVATNAATTPEGVQWGGVTGTWVASDSSMPFLVLVPQDGAQGTYVEYVTARTGSDAPYTYNWERIGTTETDLSEYAKTADLGDLAFKDTASGPIATSQISLQNGTTTAAGSIRVTLTDAAGTTTISSTGNFTPAGNITGNNALSSTSTTLSGTAAAQSFTGAKYSIDVTPTTDTVNNYTSVLATAALDGTQSYTAPVLTPASATITAATGTFATAGVTATVSGETLTLTNAATAAVDASKVTNFNGGSLTAGSVEFGGITTTNASATAKTFMTGASAELEKDATNGVQIEGTNASSVASVNGSTYAFDATKLSFGGTQGTVSVSGTYRKQVVDEQTFTGSASAVTGTVTAAGAQTVTVS